MIGPEWCGWLLKFSVSPTKTTSLEWISGYFARLKRDIGTRRQRCSTRFLLLVFFGLSGRKGVRPSIKEETRTPGLPYKLLISSSMINTVTGANSNWILDLELLLKFLTRFGDYPLMELSKLTQMHALTKTKKLLNQG